jgi:hypothetical protein
MINCREAMCDCTFVSRRGFAMISIDENLRCKFFFGGETLEFGEFSPVGGAGSDVEPASPVFCTNLAGNEADLWRDVDSEREEEEEREELESRGFEKVT